MEHREPRRSFNEGVHGIGIALRRLPLVAAPAGEVPQVQPTGRRQEASRRLLRLVGPDRERRRRLDGRDGDDGRHVETTAGRREGDLDGRFDLAVEEHERAVAERRELDLCHRDADRRLGLGIFADGWDAEGDLLAVRVALGDPVKGRVAARANELVEPRLEIFLSLAGLGLRDVRLSQQQTKVVTREEKERE
jgi:hypothetical protein